MEQLAPPVERPRQDRFEKPRRGGVIGHREQLAKLSERLFDRSALAVAGEQNRPQGLLPPSLRDVVQLILIPPDQRRHEQIGERQIIERLDRKSHRGEQIAHRQWAMEMQPVDPRYRHSFGKQSRHQQRRQLTPAPYQDQHIARRQRSPGAGHHRCLVDPLSNRLREMGGIAPLGFTKPALFAGLTFILGLDHKCGPPFDPPRPCRMESLVPRRSIGQAHRAKANLSDNCIDQTQYDWR